MAQPAARKDDTHTCPLHTGGPIVQGWSNILIGNKDAAAVGHTCTCVGAVDVIAQGSPTVLMCNQQAARVTDMTAHRGLITSGLATVLVGIDPFLEAIIAAVNTVGSTINCGFIIDAVRSRLTGSDPNASAPNQQDGSFSDIEGRFNTKINWNQSFQSAFDAVRNGGNGTTAIIGVQYSGGGAHVLVMTNRNGTVAIMEGQDWGTGNPREVITNPARADQRYNSDGASNIGWGIVH